MNKKGGKKEVPIYVYDENGKYLFAFANQTECFNYYGLSQGNLFGDKQYRLMPDGHYIAKYRIGRDGLREAILLDKNKFCKVLDGDFGVEIFNIKNEKIGEFRSFRELLEISDIPKSTLTGLFHKKGEKYLKKDRPIIIKRKDYTHE
ncbi:hypothetical protein [Sphingobacterium sp. ML3W]|uniref:hypothetical protein n=1 Tax=Sphingobacterium sp. ML3W TaxID=1538644 RepID=UPI002499CE36|nr:hypothetical protein [Sphingobacterium sp. ML3W]WFA79686.1 hypothetical protein OGI71_27080 [Sphingobacterium sp. ML3W]